MGSGNTLNGKGDDGRAATMAYDYGIIGVKVQDEDAELPMQPITAMRNSLGTKFGGSGVPIDIQSYNRCVDFWHRHATIK